MQAWLCSLPSVPSDLEGLTVGKTILQRVVRTHELTLDPSLAPVRPTYDPSLLSAWPWLPQHDTGPGSSSSSSMSEAEGGCKAAAASAAERWIQVDACPSDPTTLLSTLGNDSTALLDAGADVIRGSVMASGFGSLFNSSEPSFGAVWWAGQLAVHSLAASGPCTQAAAEHIRRRSGAHHGRDSAALGTNAGHRHLPVGNDDELVLAMHIRRGDACMRWTSTRGDWRTKPHGRPCWTTEAYVAAAEDMRDRYGVRVLRLATDSAVAMREVEEVLGGRGWEVHALRYDRVAVGGQEGVNEGSTVSDERHVFIEKRMREGDPSLDRSLVIGSLAAELELLSGADMMIGTARSQVTRLAFLAMVGRLGRTPPFIFLDSGLGCLRMAKCVKHPNRHSHDHHNDVETAAAVDHSGASSRQHDHQQLSRMFPPWWITVLMATICMTLCAKQVL